MPDRLSDIVNVKDWGAVGDGLHADRVAIQSAIDYCIGRGGGTVFFPNGGYKIDAGLEVGSDNPNISVDLVGCGKGATNLSATFNGWMISKGTRQYDNIHRVQGMNLQNQVQSVTSGAIKIEGTDVVVEDIEFSSCFNGCDASAADGVSIRDCSGHGGEAFDAGVGGPHPFATASIGIALGKNCTASGCRLQLFGIGYALGGDCASLITSNCENCSTAIRVGWNPSGEVEVHGCSVLSYQTEACRVSLDLYNAHNCYIGSCLPTGTVTSPRTPSPITAGSYNNLTGRVTVTSAHHYIDSVQPAINDGSYAIMIAGPSAYSAPSYPSQWRPTGFTWITVKDVDSFSYAVPSDPGAFSGPIATLNYQENSRDATNSYGTVTVGYSSSIPIEASSVGALVRLSGLNAFWTTGGTDRTVDGGATTTHFTYPLTVPLASLPAPRYTSGGAWIRVLSFLYPVNCTNRFRKVTETVLMTPGPGAVSPYGSIDFDCEGQSEHRNNILIAVPLPYGAALPAAWPNLGLSSRSYNLAGWSFARVGQYDWTLGPITGRRPGVVLSPVGQMKFADLPGQFTPAAGVTWYPDGPIEGQEFDIKDGRAYPSGGTANSGDVVQGGGGQHIKVRYDGQAGNWKRIG
jgi:hypothetical protein